MPLHVSSICAHHQEVKIALHSLWYQHTYRWPYRARVETKPIVKQILCIRLVKYEINMMRCTASEIPKTWSELAD